MIDIDNYITHVKRTESPLFCIDNVNTRILHGVVGCCTESSELLDAVKRSLFYGTELDLVNLHEEIGDLMYYIALIVDATSGDFDAIIQTNINKLKKRFPDKFTNTDAVNRDLIAERAILEKQKT